MYKVFSTLLYIIGLKTADSRVILTVEAPVGSGQLAQTSPSRFPFYTSSSSVRL